MAATRLGKTFDALVFGYYAGEVDLRRPHAGTDSRRRPGTAVQAVPRAGDQGLPIRESARGKRGRWGAGLTAAKMKDCRWLKPVLVGQFEFVEWTGENHLRHTKFIALRDDQTGTQVTAGVAIVDRGHPSPGPLSPGLTRPVVS